MDFTRTIDMEENTNRLQMTEEFIEKRQKLQRIEAEIKRITNDTKRWEYKEKVIGKIENLVHGRWLLLRDMFLGTPSEVARFEQVNARLYDLTKKMYRRGADLYRQLLTAPVDPDFDDDKNFDYTLQYAYNGKESVLWLEEDEYYGSDFDSMIGIIDTLHYAQYKFARDHRTIESRSASYDTDKTSDMTDEELGFRDISDDGVSWGHSGTIAHPALEHICVCHAVYRVCSNDFSRQDLLRLNDFWIEIKITHQHIVDQDGTRAGWWNDFTFDEFRQKMQAEADYRPAGWSRGKFISERCRRAIFEYHDDFKSENDPLHDDSKIDAFLADVFAEMQRQ